MIKNLLIKAETEAADVEEKLNSYLTGDQRMSGKSLFIRFK